MLHGEHAAQPHRHMSGGSLAVAKSSHAMPQKEGAAAACYTAQRCLITSVMQPVRLTTIYSIELCHVHK